MEISTAFKVERTPVRLVAVILTAAMTFVGACATTPDVKMEQGVTLARFTQVEVAPAQNETGIAENEQAANTFQKDLVSALRSNGISVTQSGTPGTTLVVIPTLVHYEAGSAVSRWIVPGSGRTQATVSAALIDKASGQSLGDLASTQQVAGGGLFSVGADRWVLTQLANGLANEIGARLRGEQAEAQHR
jgi:TolB-like protein